MDVKLYYHVLLHTDETRDIYELDKDNIATIEQKIIQKILKNEIFLFDGHIIDPSKIKRFIISQTEKNSDYYYSKIIKEKEKKGRPTSIEKGYYVTYFKKYRKNITDELYGKNKNQKTDTTDIIRDKTINDDVDKGLKISKSEDLSTEKSLKVIMDELLDSINSTFSSSDRGKRFEEFIAILVSKVERLSVAYMNFLSDYGEFDIVVKNNREDRPWSDLPSYFPVECKWRDENEGKVGIKELRDFVQKIEHMKQINMGLLFTNANFTKDLQRERNMVLSRSGIRIGLINGKMIRTVLKKETTVEKLIIEAIERASLGGK